jgi:DNA-binding beta-propeller fold protein YncE
MRNVRFRMMVVVLALVLVASAGIASAQDGGTTVAGGFNSPQGILVAPDGSVWVIDSGVGGEVEVPSVNPETGEEVTALMGETSRVVSIAADGTQTVAATLPSLLSGQETVGGARLALLDGTLYATGGIWLGAVSDEAIPNMAAVVKIEDGQATEVARTWELEKAQNPDPNILDSHPYGITAGADGNLWVADAGGNTLLKVDPASGQIDLVTVFAGLPGPFPNPARGGAMEMDPVPTAVAFDGEGNIYVSLLPGFPFLPGSGKVVRVSADGQVSDYATGLVMVTDLRTGPDGKLYGVQMAQPTEQGPVPDSGSIVRIEEGNASEVILSGLSFPTSLDFNSAGDAYVIKNGVGAPGSGEVVMYAGLTAMEGTPLAAAAAPAPPEAMPETGGAPLDLGLIVAAAGALLLGGGLLLGRGWGAIQAQKD